MTNETLNNLNDFEVSFVFALKLLEAIKKGQQGNGINLAVVGSREFNNYDLLKKTLDKFDIQCIVSGGAPGADTLAENYAHTNKISTKIFRPDWQKHGKKAGFLRNALIVEACDMLIAFWDGQSRGTQHSINMCKKAGKQVHIVRYKEITDATQI